MNLVRAFFPKIRTLFFKFWKRAEETSPLPPLLLRACSYQRNMYVINVKTLKINYVHTGTAKLLCNQFLHINLNRDNLNHKAGVLKNWAKFWGKQLCRSLFWIRLQTAALLERTIWYSCFPATFSKCLEYFL